MNFNYKNTPDNSTDAEANASCAGPGCPPRDTGRNSRGSYLIAQTQDQVKGKIPTSGNAVLSLQDTTAQGGTCRRSSTSQGGRSPRACPGPSYRPYRHNDIFWLGVVAFILVLLLILLRIYFERSHT